MSSNYSESDYREKVEKIPARVLRGKSHYPETALKTLQKSWFFNSTRFPEHLKFEHSIESSHPIRLEYLYIKEKFFYNGTDKNPLPDFEYVYKIHLENLKKYEEDSYMFAFGKQVLEDLDPEVKQKVCESRHASEFSLEEGIFPFKKVFYQYPVAISKLANKCNGISLVYRAVCDDLLVLDHSGVIIGRMQLLDSEALPILRTSNRHLLKCYKGIKVP